MRKTVLPGLVLGAIIILAAGCGGSSGTKKSVDTTSTPASTSTPQQTFTVNESEFKLSPSTLNVSKPGSVEIKIVNKGSIDHAFEVEGNGVEQKSSTVGAGKSTTLTVNLSKAGSYEMYCPIDSHKDQGMKGTITVGGSSAGGGGTTTGTTTENKSGGGYSYG